MTAVAKPADRCLWLGPIMSRLAVDELPALSPAAVEWQRGFIGGLITEGVQVHAISHRPAPLWPRGPLLPGSQSVPSDVTCPTRLVGYVNAPIVRSSWLAKAYVRAIDDFWPAWQPNLVATFNLLPWHVIAAKAASERHQIPWLSFLLDDVSSDPTLGKYARLSRAAAGHVVVSAEAVNRLRQLNLSAPILHIDGGVDHFHDVDKSEAAAIPKSILYCGSHTDEAGMGLLVEAIPLVPQRDVSFVITGNRGSHDGLARLAGRDPRVRLMGLVSPEELDALCESATAFVNPRPPGHALSIASFPSKLLRYLSFGKPIASTWTPGLSADYRSLLVLAEDGSPKSLADAIQKVIWLDSASRDAVRLAARDFLVPGRLWATQARKFIEFVNEVLRPLPQRMRGVTLS